MITEKERRPLSVKECIEAPADTGHRWRKRSFILFVIIFGSFCYILNHAVTQDIEINPPKYVIEPDIQNISRNADNISTVISKETILPKVTQPNSTNNYLTETMRNVSNALISTLKTIFSREIYKLSPDEVLCTTEVEEKSEVVVNKTAQSLILHKQYSMVKMGGYYVPSDCKPRHKVGILVPYRDRETNLAVFMFNIHPFLMKQKLEYRIFIIEQAGKESFNRGLLFNVGFKEMMKYGDWHCVVFHDVDLLPLDNKIFYTCPMFPRHMCATVLEKQGLPYSKYHTLFGGVAAMSIEHYKKVNGYSNMYWGWGGEDDDMFWRLRASHLPIVRYNKSVARYTSLPHPKQPENPIRYRLLRDATERFKIDGLANLVYKVLSTKLRHLYTHIIVDINPLKENISETNNKLWFG